MNQKQLLLFQDIRSYLDDNRNVVKKDIFHVYTNEQEKRANITVEGVQDTLFSTTPCVINLLCSNETDKLIKSDLKTQILKIKNEKHNSEAL